MLAHFPGGLRLLGSAVKSSTIVSVAWRTVNVDVRCKSNDTSRGMTCLLARHLGIFPLARAKGCRRIDFVVCEMEMMPPCAWFCSSPSPSLPHVIDF
jgi:hypothetical protein